MNPTRADPKQASLLQGMQGAGVSGSIAVQRTPGDMPGRLFRVQLVATVTTARDIYPALPSPTGLTARTRIDAGPDWAGVAFVQVVSVSGGPSCQISYSSLAT